MKFIVITGGVVSGIGKGVISSSTGKILQSHGRKVTFIKIDPYLNLDAGTLTPLDHGEVFVLADGSEVDLDLGNYERFLNINLARENNITTGKVYKEIIKKERKGAFLGKTVQCVPHLTDLIQKNILIAATKKIGCGLNTMGEKEYEDPEVCIIELGGTVGDIESVVFIEALRQLKVKAGPDNFMIIGVEYVPIISNGEQKTKPIQNSIKIAQSYGIKPDIIVGRCADTLQKSTKSKIALFCEVNEENIFNMPDLDTVFRAPSFLMSQNYDKSIMKILNLPSLKESQITIPFSYLLDSKGGSGVEISIVGKYVRNLDCYISLKNALDFSAAQLGISMNVNWIEAEDIALNKEKAMQQLTSSSGIIIPGGFGSRGFEGKIKAIKFARENNIPFLGICLGFQLSIIEFSKNVLHIDNATSQEFNEEQEDCVVIRMECNGEAKLDGSMILGEKPVFIKPNSKLSEIYYNNKVVLERFRHRYKVNPIYVDQLEKSGIVFVADNGTEESIKNAFELPDHPFFIGVQFHPEFLARPEAPHRLFTEFLRNSSG